MAFDQRANGPNNVSISCYYNQFITPWKYSFLANKVYPLTKHVS